MINLSSISALLPSRGTVLATALVVNVVYVAVALQTAQVNFTSLREYSNAISSSLSSLSLNCRNAESTDKESMTLMVRSRNELDSANVVTQRHGHDCRVKKGEGLRYCKMLGLLRKDEATLKRFETQRKATGYYLSACTAVKDAGDVLHEFIVRNYLAGVDHFYIYDDNDADSIDNVTETLHQFSPLLTIQEPPDNAEFLRMIGRDSSGYVRALKNRQHMMYWHCFKEHGSKSRWLMPIDSDEFLEAKRPEELESGSRPFEDVPFMHTYLRRIENKVPAQIGRWNTVMTNDKILPPGPSIRTLSEKYPVTCGTKDTFSDPSEPGFLFSAKSVIQPRFLDMAHYRKKGMFFVHGIKHWEKDKRRAKELFFTEPYKNYSVPVSTTETGWYILHYWSRSLADFIFKRERGRADGMSRRTLDELFERERLCRANGDPVLSRSAVRRQKMVEELLKQIDGFEDVQLRYHSMASELLRQRRNRGVVGEYRDFMSQMEAR